ncbi:hrf1 family protein [Cystoisospora suis]|uniref:Hrf1 family protein n=1 Tax=Cystoisospora suis TaxID=483139 RepID=A0A2C6LD25_9APIC|nr:hrf1 family protein [Cystoisospora suis]
MLTSGPLRRLCGGAVPRRVLSVQAQGKTCLAGASLAALSSRVVASKKELFGKALSSPETRQALVGGTRERAALACLGSLLSCSSLFLVVPVRHHASVSVPDNPADSPVVAEGEPVGKEKNTPGQNPDSDVELAKKLDDLVKSAAVVLFMKGSPDAPMCGFSARAVCILNSLDVEEYTFVNILQYPNVRALAKKHFNWPTYPMLIVGGEVVGGVDIMDELNKSGELRSAIFKALSDYDASTRNHSDEQQPWQAYQAAHGPSQCPFQQSSEERNESVQSQHARPRHPACLASNRPQGGPPRPSQPPSGEASGSGVWSSPFSSQGHDTAHSVLPEGARDPASTQTEGAQSMQNVVMEAMFTTVADNLSSKAATQVSQLQKWFPSAIGVLRPYFSVSQTSVRSRLLQLLFPFCALWNPASASQRSLSAREMDGHGARTPDGVSKDLYTPLMALITYVLLYALTRGAANDFQPELLGRTASLALLLLMGEVILAKVSFYFAGARAVPTLDLFSYCGCKYVHLALLIAFRLLINTLTSLEPGVTRSSLASAEASGTLGVIAEDGEAGTDTGGDERGGADGLGLSSSTKELVVGSRVNGESLMWIYTTAYLYLLACAAAELFVLLRSVSRCSQENCVGSNWRVSRDGCRQSAPEYVVVALSLLQLPLCWLLTPSFAPSR